MVIKQEQVEKGPGVAIHTESGEDAKKVEQLITDGYIYRALQRSEYKETLKRVGCLIGIVLLVVAGYYWFHTSKVAEEQYFIKTIVGATEKASSDLNNGKSFGETLFGWSDARWGAFQTFLDGVDLSHCPDDFKQSFRDFKQACASHDTTAMDRAWIGVQAVANAHLKATS